MRERGTDEQEAARHRVMAWWKNDCGWGRVAPEVEPAPQKGNSQGIFEKHQVVTPSPSSTKARAPKLHQCRDCELMIGGTAWRCPEHRRAHRLFKQLASQHRICARKAAARGPAAVCNIG